ncbi:hypothetical protein ACL02T_02895 [Pseudonocardia sp. RS010]|uniref:hypothetical protein n=1 Tax=Pseudonocardia sp. RS010 TaxID=3385979 RepID=UPI00399F67B1
MTARSVPTAHPPPGPRRAGSPDVADVLGPLVAWMASREPHEGLRRRQVRVVERFLRWAAADGGDPRTRRERFEAEPGIAGPAEAYTVSAALDRLAEHRRILALPPIPTRGERTTGMPRAPGTPPLSSAHPARPGVPRPVGGGRRGAT